MHRRRRSDRESLLSKFVMRSREIMELRLVLARFKNMLSEARSELLPDALG